MVDAHLSRRGFLLGAGAAGAGLVLAGAPAGAVASDAAAARLFDAVGYPFQLGVASGDPLPRSVVLWTRLAPEPFAPDWGLSQQEIRVRWEIATDERFGSSVVRRGSVVSRRAEGHSVHVDVRGLDPARDYWYRFRAGNEISPVGRTRTALAPWMSDPVDFCFASCSQYEHGYFTAYRHLAEEYPDVVFHLGDYIYEYASDVYVADDGNVRNHIGDEIRTMADYRQRYAQYKTDPDLQAAHAAAPWIVIWDDHEVDNNYADGIPEDDDRAEGNRNAETFAARKAAAYQVYWENMPLRRSRKPMDGSLPLYRRFDYGRTARFNLLDTRQYRNDQPCDDVFGASCDAVDDPDRTILGAEQAAWLEEGLSSSQATWNIVPQQIFLASLDVEPGPPSGGYNDGWDGYRSSRTRLLDYVADRGIDNFVVLTGDVHSAWLADLRVDFEDESLPVIGTELACTSITSNGDGSAASFVPALQPENPHLRFNDQRRGYTRARVDPNQLTGDFRALEVVTVPGQPISTIQSFAIDAGDPVARLV